MPSSTRGEWCPLVTQEVLRKNSTCCPCHERCAALIYNAHPARGTQMAACSIQGIIPWTPGGSWPGQHGHEQQHKSQVSQLCPQYQAAGAAADRADQVKCTLTSAPIPKTRLLVCDIHCHHTFDSRGIDRLSSITIPRASHSLPDPV